MDRLGFFKQGLSSMLDVAGSIVGLKHAVNSFTEVVDEALSNIKTDIGLHLPSLDAGMYDDPRGTLSEVANIGYTTLEIGSYYGGKIHNMAPEEFKALVEKYGLKITSAHINHLYEGTDDSTLGAYTNSADAEAAKRAARWAAMNSGAIAEGITAEGATAEGTKAEGSKAEGSKAEESKAEESKAEGTSERIEDAEDTKEEIKAENVADAAADVAAENPEVAEDTSTAEDDDTDEAKPDPNDEWWCEALDIHRNIGCKYIVTSRLPDYPTDEVVAQYATYFNRIGTLAAERGMQFCYHPQMQQLKAENGKSTFETIIANTDPEKVALEIDTYEAAEAGVDVVELLKRLSQRVALLHIRDYGVLGESTKIDFEKIIAEAIRTGVKDIFVEVRNFSLPPMNCIERSFYYVESLPSIRY